MLRLYACVLSALLLLPLAACETTTSGGAVGADRPQLMLVSSQQLDRMAAESYAKLLADAASKGVLNRDGAMLQRVRTVARRIEPQTAVFRRDAPHWKWETNLLASDELNAFCMPGGKIMVFSGLVSRLALTDAEIAVVMGHEIAHALREHSREHVSQAMAGRGHAVAQDDRCARRRTRARVPEQPPGRLEPGAADRSAVADAHAALPGRARAAVKGLR